jgi:hypothetical protein
MAKRARKKARIPRGAVATIVVACIVAALWLGYHHLNRRVQESLQAKILKTPAADIIDPANEGSHLQVTGLLTADGSARDPQLGVSARAAALLRHVEMYQWREHCVGATCQYDTAWGVPQDSRTFRQPRGHENPTAPFADATFAAPELKLGAYAVNVAVPVAQLPAHDYPVGDASLSPNMAASFATSAGVLYAGGDPAHPQLGMVRVSYRVVPLGAATLSGVQRGDRLTAD